MKLTSYSSLMLIKKACGVRCGIVGGVDLDLHGDASGSQSCRIPAPDAQRENRKQIHRYLATISLSVSSALPTATAGDFSPAVFYLVLLFIVSLRRLPG